MRRWIVATAGAALVAVVPQAAQAMTVAEFLAKTNALKAKGFLAIGSSDIALLKNEVDTVSAAYRADLERQKRAGRPPHSCPPPRGQTSMKSSEFIAELERIPVAQRGMSMKAAFYAMMKRRYPCRA